MHRLWSAPIAQAVRWRPSTQAVAVTVTATSATAVRRSVRPSPTLCETCFGREHGGGRRALSTSVVARREEGVGRHGGSQREEGQAASSPSETDTPSSSSPNPPSASSPTSSSSPSQSLETDGAPAIGTDSNAGPSPQSATPTSSSSRQETTRSSVSFAQLWQSLPPDLRQRALALSSKAQEHVGVLQSRLNNLGHKLNEMTGYEAVNRLKEAVVGHDLLLSDLRKEARSAKAAYESAVRTRAASQREVNELLQRKSSWTGSDVSRFTTLVREDHLNEQAETAAKAAYDEAEERVERQFDELMRAVMTRYHEEHLWSDKIRSASTYGSLIVVGLNLVVFLLAIVVVEPWKRKKLAQTLEKRLLEGEESGRKLVRETLERFEQTVSAQDERLDALLDKQDKLLFASVAGGGELPARTGSAVHSGGGEQDDDEGGYRFTSEEEAVAKEASRKRERELLTAGAGGVVLGAVAMSVAGYLFGS